MNINEITANFRKIPHLMASSQPKHARQQPPDQGQHRRSRQPDQRANAQSRKRPAKARPRQPQYRAH